MPIGELHFAWFHFTGFISPIANLSEPRLRFADKFWAKVSA
jgi:hypothetical protein